MENNFDLKKFLLENKLTTNSRQLNEGVALGHLMNGSDVNNDVIVVPAMSYDDEAHAKRHALRPIRKEGNNIIFTPVGQDGEEKQYAIKGGEVPDLVLYTDAIKGIRENNRHLGENEYSSEEEDRVHQIMSIVKEKIGFDYPIFEDIVEDAIALIDEQEGTGAVAALYAAAETWNEEFQENGDENGEDITSRMMSILESMEESISEADPQAPSDVKFASKATAQAKNVGTANSRIDQQSEFAGAFENWFSSLGYKPGKITKSLVRGQIDAVLSKLGYK